MATAFQPDSFQNDAFQVGGEPLPAKPHGGKKTSHPYLWTNNRVDPDEEEMKLSLYLIQQLNEVNKARVAEAQNAQLMQEMNRELIQEIKVMRFNPENRPEPVIKATNSIQKAEEARLKAEERRREELAQQRLENLKKAREVRAKNLRKRK